MKVRYVTLKFAEFYVKVYIKIEKRYLKYSISHKAV